LGNHCFPNFPIGIDKEKKAHQFQVINGITLPQSDSHSHSARSRRIQSFPQWIPRLRFAARGMTVKTERHNPINTL